MASSSGKKTLLYKYRGLSNLQFALDIFVNQRMFAARFDSLNDPMEGRYLYDRDSLTASQRDRIYGKKQRLRILSLSETASNMLMWSYYAEANTGMAVGVDVVDLSARRVRAVAVHSSISKFA